MKKFIWAALILGLMVILGISVYDWIISTSKEEESTVEKDDSESLAVKINFAVGELAIQGGSANWLDATFESKNKKLLPHVKYKSKKGIGAVTIEQKSTTFRFNKVKEKNHWDIQLNNHIPIDLDVDMGVSKATLNLKGLQVNNLTIDGGVSDSIVDLSGQWENNLKGDFDIGVGQMTLLLPKQTGVKLNIDKGLGKIEVKDFIALGDNVYVNEAYESNGVSIEIDVDIGIGNLKAQLVE